jgi:hypothetical protein
MATWHGRRKTALICGVGGQDGGYLAAHLLGPGIGWWAQVAMPRRAATRASCGSEKKDSPKGNQGTLRDGIETFFAEYADGEAPTSPVRKRRSTSKGHGRREERWHYVSSVPRNLPDQDRWPGLKAIGMAISNVERDGKTCVDVRYYILSKKMPVQKFASIV